MWYSSSSLIISENDEDSLLSHSLYIILAMKHEKQNVSRENEKKVALYTLAFFKLW
jgi:hypothetical protein